MKKTKYISLTMVLSIAVCYSYAQNLVPNYSFEIYSSCPTAPAQINKATPWYDPTGATSDYFNACAPTIVNVPFCATGYQYARTGSAYAGLFALNGFGNGGREYIQVKLDSVLKQDSCYLIEFYCNLWNRYGYTIKTLGAYLSNTAVSTIGPVSVMSYTPQIVSNVFLTDTLNWMRVNGYYKAVGGEKYITIGNFKPFSIGDTLYNGVGTYPGCAYLIDDVTVKKISGCDTMPKKDTTTVKECGEVFIPNAFSPDNNGANDMECVYGNCIATMQFVIYDRWGEKVFETTDSKQCWNGTYKGTSMNTAVFVYYFKATLTTGEKITKKGNISLIR